MGALEFLWMCLGGDKVVLSVLQLLCESFLQLVRIVMVDRWWVLVLIILSSKIKEVRFLFENLLNRVGVVGRRREEEEEKED